MAVDPQGNEKYWFAGLPFEGLKKQDEGTEKYWFEGLPGKLLYPVGVAAELGAFYMQMDPLGINILRAGNVRAG